MPKTFAYLEQCRDMHAQISEGRFESEVLEENGWGSQYSFRSFGNVTLGGGEVVYIGQKRPAPGNNQPVRTRVRQELLVGGIIGYYCPELIGMLPRFIGAEDNNIITEDASMSGRLAVWQAPASDFVRESLTEGLAQFADDPYLLRNDELNNSFAFEVGSGERLLDLTPMPFSLSAYRRALEDTDIFEQAHDLSRQLRFTFTEASK